MKKEKPEAVKVVYYWKRGDGVYGIQIVHNTCYSEIDSAVSVSAAKKLAEKLGYRAEESNE